MTNAFVIALFGLLYCTKAAPFYFLVESYSEADAQVDCQTNGGELLQYTSSAINQICCTGCTDCNSCFKEDITLFQHFHSKADDALDQLEIFVNTMSPSSVTRIFGGISYPDLHLWVPHDDSGKQYKLHLTNWAPQEFVGTNVDIDIANNAAMMIGFKPATGGPYAYWAEEIINPFDQRIPCSVQTTLFNRQHSQEMAAIEQFINQMQPSSVTRIFGAVSFPDLHVWAANDQSGKQYKFHKTNWGLGYFAGTNVGIDIALNKIMIFDFKPATGDPAYCYWIEEATVISAYSGYNSVDLPEPPKIDVINYCLDQNYIIMMYTLFLISIFINITYFIRYLCHKCKTDDENKMFISS